MGWKEGDSLGSSQEGLKIPLWVDPREGKSGIFSTADGEARPKKDERPEEEKYADFKPFLSSGEFAPRKRPRIQKPPPTAATVAPAVLNLLVRPGGANDLGGMSAVADILAEVLAGDAGIRFL